VYDVPADSISKFIKAYGSAGDWARLFARAEGFVRTELYRSAEAQARFVTVDVWSNEAAWQAFVNRWGAAYAVLEPLAAGGTLLVEGSQE
jgi:heme-degrading monooxygenase HmoA